MQLNGGRIGVGKRKSHPGGYSYGGGTPSPAPTNVPGTYGGPPGSFITTSRCPTGYNSVQLSRGDIRCVPAPRPVISQPPVQAPVTISPTFKQEFTPQFSPVVQQQQDSPGADQTASPTQAVVPKVLTAPSPAPISDVYSIPSALPVPSPIPDVITAPAPAPTQAPEKKSFLPDLKGNYLPFILIAGVAVLSQRNKK